MDVLSFRDLLDGSIDLTSCSGGSCTVVLVLTRIGLAFDANLDILVPTLALGVSEKASEPITPMLELVERTSFVASLVYCLISMGRTMLQTEVVVSEPMLTNASTVGSRTVEGVPLVSLTVALQRSNFSEVYFVTTSSVVGA